MPRFRFVAADSTGQVHDGAIDAATQTDARHKLASNGLAVRELEETTAGVEPLAAPARRSSSNSGEPPEKLPIRSPARSAPEESTGRGSSAPLALAIIAVIISVATAVYTLSRDPYSNRLSRYDFSTPEAAYLSHLRMEAAADLPAMLELQRRDKAKHFRDKLEAVKIVKTEECRGKTILFVEYTIDANMTREVHYFEPDPNYPRAWRMTHISDQELLAFDPSLAERVARWPATRTGDFAPMKGMPRVP